MRIIQNILRESKRSKKKAKDEPEEEPKPVKTINVKIGDREWDNFPESEAKRVTSLIRQIVRGTLKSSSVVDDLVSQVPGAKQEKLRKVLEEIQKEHGPVAISRIPESFPFLEAEGGSEYLLSGLDDDSMAFLDTEQGTTGRGEIAIALLFGVEEFLTPQEKGEKRSSVSSYDLVYKGKQCDVKDARTMLKDGSVKLQNYVRLGGVVSRRIELAVDDILNQYKTYLRARDFFANQTNGTDFLGILALEDQSVNNPEQMVSTAKKLFIEIMTKIDSIIKDNVETEYPGGIFIITKEKIRLYDPSEFVMYALKGDGRCSVEYVDSDDESYFRKGVLNHLERNKQKIFDEYYEDVNKKKPEEPEVKEPEEIPDLPPEEPEPVV